MLLRSSLRPAARLGQGSRAVPFTAARALATVSSSFPDVRHREVRRLDLGRYLQGDAREKQDFCTQLSHELQYTGFTKLSNHGIANSDIDQVFAWVSKDLDCQCHSLYDY